MSKVILVAGLASHIPYDTQYDYIGIDAGAYACMKQKVPMKFAIGDFDSITAEQKEKLVAYTSMIKLPKHKDQTDSEAAIYFALEQGYKEIILFGGLGGRIDHTLANVYLLAYRNLPLTLMDEHNKMYIRSKGKYEITNDYQYLSFLALEKTQFTISGVAYPLVKRTICKQDIYTISNEIIKESAFLEIEEGSLLVMQASDADK